VYLDTTIVGVRGVFFDSPEPEPIAAAIEVALAVPWHERTLLAHAETFGSARFVGRLKEIIDDERALL
jgi:hypothetical protein